jgi:hypothetical protein
MEEIGDIDDRIFVSTGDNDPYEECASWLKSHGCVIGERHENSPISVSFSEDETTVLFNIARYQGKFIHGWIAFPHGVKDGFDVEFRVSLSGKLFLSERKNSETFTKDKS